MDNLVLILDDLNKEIVERFEELKQNGYELRRYGQKKLRQIEWLMKRYDNISNEEWNQLKGLKNVIEQMMRYSNSG